MPDDTHTAGFDRQLFTQAGATHGYQKIPQGLRLGECADDEFFCRHFVGHTHAETAAEVPGSRAALVTGFGPTNAPTAGTLSAMLAACELQRRSGLHTTIVVSDLGAWNSRNAPWQHLEECRDKMLAFLAELGFDSGNGILRTHQDMPNLVLSGKIAKFLTGRDFAANKEVLDELYQDLGIRGTQLGIMIDGLYTIADIVGPLNTGYDQVVILAGIEEHYFAELSQLLLTRCREQVPGELFPPKARVGALFLGVVPGLAGHEKMSKSIPASAVRLDESDASIRQKIADAQPVDDPVIMRMIELASTWPTDQVAEARALFESRNASANGWQQVKHAYTDHLTGFARLWRSAKGQLT